MVTVVMNTKASHDNMWVVSPQIQKQVMEILDTLWNFSYKYKSKLYWSDCEYTYIDTKASFIRIYYG